MGKPLDPFECLLKSPLVNGERKPKASRSGRSKGFSRNDQNLLILQQIDRELKAVFRDLTHIREDVEGSSRPVYPHTREAP